MNQICIQYFQTEVGELIMGSFENKLCLLDYRHREKRSTIDKRLKKGLKAQFIDVDSEVLQLTRTQLNEYFTSQRKTLDVALLMVGTQFQKSVWNALLKIQYGETTSYRQLSKNINNEKAVRAVANVNGANAMSIVIPCHRIIGSNGALVGYAGGLEAKQKLLDLEQSTVINH